MGSPFSSISVCKISKYLFFLTMDFLRFLMLNMGLNGTKSSFVVIWSSYYSLTVFHSAKDYIENPFLQWEMQIILDLEILNLAKEI